jgi:hypothetical protein
MTTHEHCTRRDVLRTAAMGIGAGWASHVAGPLSRAAAAGKSHKSCILLWMSGGPSHKDTFDLKPNTPDAGEFRPIATSVPGIEISEHFPLLARQMQHAAIIRSMSTGEADHGRAGVFLHTGFLPTNGGVKYPNVGAIASAELGQPGFLLPNFVVCGEGNRVNPGSSGFLGPQHEGLVVLDAAKGLEDLKPSVVEQEFHDRLALLERLQNSTRSTQSAAALAQRATYGRAISLMRSDQARAFDLSQEPAASADRYGPHAFGKGCLMARRLIEVGVPFVEVILPGWDTHQRGAVEIRRLSQIVDPATSALLEDLQDRGRLGDTLVIWMGEFGRTPRVNSQAGRDHYARAWSTVLAGGGIRAGQIVGRTDAEGAQVLDRPVSVPDFMATLFALLNIDGEKVYEGPGGRTVKLLNSEAKAVQELLPGRA